MITTAGYPSTNPSKLQDFAKAFEYGSKDTYDNN